ncbi:MAG: hypothetical protein IT290_00815 [Deltaproteobacteria bacterium]|nr:hypothetical protein [Deltaproteobacteria bacterium]
MRLRNPFLVIVAMLNIVGCSPVQGYPGPALPSEEVATVKRDYDESEVDLARITADGIDFAYSGIALLPGKHTFLAGVTAKEEPRNCRPYTRFNTYGYEQCLDEKYKDDRHRDDSYYAFPQCDCFDYLEVHRTCDQDVHDTQCELVAQLSAGRRYDIQLSKSGTSGVISIREAGASSALSERSCRVAGSRVTEFEENLGTGRSTANYNGFYSCD